jgi:hypothetical protein
MHGGRRQISFQRYKGASVKQLHERVKAIEILDAHRPRFVLHTPWPDFLTVYSGRAHGATQYRIVPRQPGIIDLAAELLQRHPPRAYDAVQLAAASIVNHSLIAHGLPPLIFVTADDRLIAATRGEAMTAENPNLHS